MARHQNGLVLMMSRILILSPDAWQAMWLAMMGLLVLPPAMALITLGPRYPVMPKVALILLLETVLGPIWAWLVIHEAPSP